MGLIMVANKSGLQWVTIRNLMMAWVLTLPAAMLLSGSLYGLFSKLIRIDILRYNARLTYERLFALFI